MQYNQLGGKAAHLMPEGKVTLIKCRNKINTDFVNKDLASLLHPLFLTTEEKNTFSVKSQEAFRKLKNRNPSMAVNILSNSALCCLCAVSVTLRECRD